MGFKVADIRRTKFDEGFHYVALNKFNEAINIADQLKEYETKDEGAGEIYNKVALLIYTDYPIPVWEIIKNR